MRACCHAKRSSVVVVGATAVVKKKGGGINESISVLLYVCSQQGERWENC